MSKEARVGSIAGTRVGHLFRERHLPLGVMADDDEDSSRADNFGGNFPEIRGTNGALPSAQSPTNGNAHEREPGEPTLSLSAAFDDVVKSVFSCDSKRPRNELEEDPQESSKLKRVRCQEELTVVRYHILS